MTFTISGKNYFKMLVVRLLLHPEEVIVAGADAVPPGRLYCFSVRVM
ncbi:MAG TPA: hypothetical protein VGR39_05975 [Candidatus Acidoferrales bacterium]|nr:hypothetical protein [Candidatus Acidoferrales bacterium]